MMMMDVIAAAPDATKKPKESRDIALMKVDDGAIKVMLGVTVKSITENEADGILDMTYTLTIKMFNDYFGDMSININKSGDEVPRYRNRRYDQSGAIKPEDYSGGTDHLISCSAHRNDSVKVSSEIDMCPFIVSTYELSIKLNSLNEHSDRHKKKTVFVSRQMDDYLQFQADSIGKGVSRGDRVGVFGVSKVKKGSAKALPKIGTTKHEGLWVDLDDANYETDEVLFRFTTRRKMISNLVGVVLPCILVPVIFGEMSRQGALGTDALLTGVLTLIFAMPAEFGAGTSAWFLFAFVLCFACYAVSDPVFGLAIEVVAVGLGIALLALMYVMQHRIITDSTEGGHNLVDLVKDRSDEWKKLSIWETLCLV
jgi:hypothetical protein